MGECCSLRDRIFMFIAWLIIFGASIAVTSYLLSRVPKVDARIDSIADLSPLDVLGDPTAYLFRYEIGTQLQSGRIETITVELFNTDQEDIQFDLDDVKIQCDFEIYETVCDVKLDSSQSDWTCGVGANCLPSDCTGMCGSEVYFGTPICWLGLSTKFCAEVTMVPTDCYELRVIDSERCKFVGNLVVTQNGISDTFSINNLNIPATGTLGHEVSIDTVIGHMPFDGNLLSVNEVKGTSYNVMAESNFCSMNNVIGCRAPVRVDEGGVDHDIMEPFSRISSWSFRSGDYTLYTTNNRLVSDVFNKQNTLGSHIGTFTTNLTGCNVKFPQNQIGELVFSIDIAGRYIAEVLPECVIESVSIDCVGLDTQELMNCELDIVVGHVVGSPIFIDWNGKKSQYECVTQTEQMASITKTEDDVQFCINSIGSAQVCKNAKVIIEIDETDDGDEGQDKNNKPVDPDKEKEKAERRIRTYRTLLIITLVSLCIIGGLGALLFFLKEFIMCFRMGEDEDVVLVERF